MTLPKHEQKLMHVAKLRQGAKAWNRWRREHPHSKVNLYEEDLSGTDLAGVDLRAVSLVGAHLEGANLRGARLRKAVLMRSYLTAADLTDSSLTDADLWFANLNQANLCGCKLLRTHLTNAFLRDANLVKANLTSANLTWSKLTGADLTEAVFRGTKFYETNLEDALGLDTCRHRGRSPLDEATLRISGSLPVSFLKGCGVPAHIAGYLLPNRDSTPQSCFISYSSVDEDFCQHLCQRLKAAGMQVWFAPHDVEGGKKLHEQIGEAIQGQDRLLLVLSEASMASSWVEFEIRAARRRELDEGRHVLFPVRLVDFNAIRRWQCFDADAARDLAVEIREYYIPDFSGWRNEAEFERAATRLVRDLCRRSPIQEQADDRRPTKPSSRRRGRRG